MTSQYFNLVGGYKLPAVGLGTFTVTDEKDLTNALNVALETGYRHIDTAYFYQNEHLIGKVLKTWFDSGKLKREDVWITTKLPGCYPPDQVEGLLKQSLDNLQLEYVDLYLIHFPLYLKFKPGVGFSDTEAGKSDIIATYKKLEEQVQLGKAKTIGLSNFNQDQVRRILEAAKIKPATNQIELHAYLQQPELVKYCQDNGIVVVSYQTLGNPGLPTWTAKNNVRNMTVPDLLNDPTVKKIAAKHKKSSAQVLLRFINQKNIAVIPKSVTPSRIKENFDIFNFTLDSSDIKELESLDKGSAGRICWFDSWIGVHEHPFGKRP